MANVVSYNHVRLSELDAEGNQQIIYFMSTPMDVRVDSSVNKVLPNNVSALPAGTASLEDIISKMGVMAFKNEISVDNLTTDFRNEIENIKSALADLMYKKIEVSAFTTSEPLVRMGQNLSTISFNWELNKDPVSLKIASGARESYVTDPSARSLTDTYAIPVTSDTEFTLTAVDERNVVSEKTASIIFANDIYWGTSDYLHWINFPQYQHSMLSNYMNRTLVLNVPDENYVYYAMPTRLRLTLGEPRFFVGGFEGGFIRLPNTLDETMDFTCEYTNVAGFTEPYDVYRSTNEGFGDIVMDIR